MPALDTRKRRNVITKTLREAWASYVESRPDEEFDELETIVAESLPLADKPKTLKQDHLIGFQHKDFLGFYFVVTINNDQEFVFVGMRMLKADTAKKPEVEWDELPADISATPESMLDWCQLQTAIAYGRIARNTCPSANANARISELAMYTKIANRKLADSKSKTNYCTG